MQARAVPFASSPWSGRCLWAAAVGALLAASGFAQQNPVKPVREKDAEVLVKIRDFEGLGKHSLVKTPVILARGRNPAGDWLRVITEFDTFPLWIDELTFEYYVLTETEVDRQNVFYLFRRSVRYRDLKQGRRHLSTVFLRPAAVERYGMPVAVAVEILHKGEVVDGGSKQPASYPERWWKNPRVVESERVTVKDGYLLPRSETPFALVEIDDYEVSQ